MKHKNNKGIEAFVGMQTKISRVLIELKVFDKIAIKKDSGSTESQMAGRRSPIASLVGIIRVLYKLFRITNPYYIDYLEYMICSQHSLEHLLTIKELWCIVFYLNKLVFHFQL